MKDSMAYFRILLGRHESSIPPRLKQRGGYHCASVVQKLDCDNVPLVLEIGSEYVSHYHYLEPIHKYTHSYAVELQNHCDTSFLREGKLEKGWMVRHATLISVVTSKLTRICGYSDACRYGLRLGIEGPSAADPEDIAVGLYAYCASVPQGTARSSFCGAGSPGKRRDS